MNFFRFLEVTYVLKNIELQKDFDLKLQAETKACHELIDRQRNWFKFWARFSLIGSYLKARITGKYPEMPKLPGQKVDNKTEKEIPSGVTIPNPESQAAPGEMVPHPS